MISPLFSSTNKGRLGAEETPPLSAVRKLALFANTGMTHAQVVDIADEEVTFDLLLRRCVPAENILAADIGPIALKARGAVTADSLRRLRFDALHLCDPSFATEIVAAYGADEVACAFVVSANDAVAVAGSHALRLLAMSTQSLLALCVGSPIEAAAVLEQLPYGASLSGVAASVVVESGLRAAALRRLGYGMMQLKSQVQPSDRQMRQLGYFSSVK